MASLTSLPVDIYRNVLGRLQLREIMALFGTSRSLRCSEEFRKSVLVAHLVPNIDKFDMYDWYNRRSCFETVCRYTPDLWNRSEFSKSDLAPTGNYLSTEVFRHYRNHPKGQQFLRLIDENPSIGTEWPSRDDANSELLELAKVFLGSEIRRQHRIYRASILETLELADLCKLAVEMEKRQRLVDEWVAERKQKKPKTCWDWWR